MYLPKSAIMYYDDAYQVGRKHEKETTFGHIFALISNHVLHRCLAGWSYDHTYVRTKLATIPSGSRVSN